jgi:nitrous oxidase accessory protein NosD
MSMPHRSTPLLFLALSALVATPAVHAADIHVPVDQPTIQLGIDAAQPGDRVLVGPGTYAEHIDFLGKDIQVIGTGGAAVTTIDGTNSGRVVIFQSGESRDAVLTGFTIVNGVAQGDLYYMGGGIKVVDASPTISDNVIRKNHGCLGGGIGITGGGDPHIHHNVIRNNTAICLSAAGGGIGMVEASRATIVDNLVDDNEARMGGAMELHGEGPVLAGRNIVRSNIGGGILLYAHQIVAFDNLAIGNISGPGIVAFWNSPRTRMTLVNNTIADNYNGPRGPDLLILNGGEVDGTVVVVNNIIRTSYTSVSVSCGAGAQGHAPFKDNLIHAGNGATIEGDCDFSAGGLITGDPRFAGGAAPHGYWLMADSPAVDAGDNDAVKRIRWDITGGQRIMGGTVDLGAYEFRGD